jgi:NAD(P)-dependent dehydrogenase (short-subunit alcohol dehydrogenase family)
MKSVLVTGSNGGIGTAICELLQELGYFVIGTDIEPDKNRLDAFIQADLCSIVDSETAFANFLYELKSLKSYDSIFALVNNAAIQLLCGFIDLDIDDFKRTMNVNLIAPLILSKMVYDSLAENQGSILNVGSIHAQLTKPGFISYATSKAALLGLTKSMAVDIGEKVRVNAVQPAATETDMLLDGFRDNPNLLSDLKNFHPTKTIAKPKDIAEAVSFMISDKCRFLNGSNLDINGGIGSRLYDPA